MMRLPKFRYYSPRTIADAVAIRSDAGPEGAYVAGGTDLYPNMKRRQQTPKVVVGLSRISELSRIGEQNGRLVLGAGLLLSNVENDPRVRATVEAIERELTVDGLVLRYRTEENIDGRACRPYDAGGRMSIRS